MTLLPSSRSSRTIPRVLLLAMLATSAATPAPGQQAPKILHVGTSGSLISVGKNNQETTALATLKSFIKTETGFDNDISRQKDWRQLAQKMAAGELHVGVFLGHEFAWAYEKDPGLKPLALSVNVYRYPTAYLVASKDNAATDFAGLKGQSLAIGGDSHAFLRLYIDRECQTSGKKPEEFFSRVTASEKVEDTLDDAVDGVVQAVVVDRASLEAYKRRKPGRFKRLKLVVHSQPFLPAIIAAYDAVLDERTLQRFRKGLLDANKKERGQTLLNLFHLTKFEGVAKDFDRVRTEMVKNYPAPPLQEQK